MNLEDIKHISLKRMKVAKIDAICGEREREREWKGCGFSCPFWAVAAAELVVCIVVSSHFFLGKRALHKGRPHCLEGMHLSEHSLWA